MVDRWLRKWRHELAYGLLAAASVLALFSYQRHIAHRFEHADAISCQNRRLLLKNQQLVFTIFAQNGDRFRYYGVTSLPAAVGEALDRIATARPCATGDH